MNHFGERELKDIDTERTVDPNFERHIVCLAARLELIQKPEPLLCKRERRLLRLCRTLLHELRQQGAFLLGS